MVKEAIMMFSNLDDMERIRLIDRQGMVEILRRLPESCGDAMERAKGLHIPRTLPISEDRTIRYRQPKKVVVVGMGASAVGGDLLKGWLFDRVRIPIEVCRDYHLPAYADGETLAFTVSYSGDTEETLSGFVEALERGCMVVSVSSDGVLREFSEGLGVPLVGLPEGLPPRCALPYLLFPLVVVLERVGVLDGIEDEVREAIAVLKQTRDEIVPETPTPKNPAKGLALGVRDTIPVVYGFRHHRGVALRIKTQLNENSKVPAKWECFPELNHNETVGWTGPEALTRKLSVILIRDPDEPPEIGARIDLTRQLAIEKKAGQVLEIHARGKTRLAKMLSATYIGDFMSVYLAVLYGVDPTPVDIITEMKMGLKGRIDKVGELRERFSRVARS